MKSKVKNWVLLTALLIGWALPPIKEMKFAYVGAEVYEFLLLAVVSFTALNLLQSNLVGWGLSLLVAVAFGIKDLEHLFLMLPFVFLISAYKEAAGNRVYLIFTKKGGQNSDGSNFILFAVLSTVAWVVFLIYSISLYNSPFTNELFTSFTDAEYFVFPLVLIFICVLAFAKGQKKEGFVLLLAVCLSLTSIFYCCTAFGGTKQNANALTFPTFAFICTVLCNEDALIVALYEKAEKTVTKFAEKSR